jgi:hypothetical protein
MQWRLRLDAADSTFVTAVAGASTRIPLLLSALGLLSVLVPVPRPRPPVLPHMHAVVAVRHLRLGADLDAEGVDRPAYNLVMMRTSQFERFICQRERNWTLGAFSTRSSRRV